MAITIHRVHPSQSSPSPNQANNSSWLDTLWRQPTCIHTFALPPASPGSVRQRPVAQHRIPHQPNVFRPHRRHRGRRRGSFHAPSGLKHVAKSPKRGPVSARHEGGLLNDGAVLLGAVAGRGGAGRSGTGEKTRAVGAGWGGEEKRSVAIAQKRFFLFFLATNKPTRNTRTLSAYFVKYGMLMVVIRLFVARKAYVRLPGSVRWVYAMMLFAFNWTSPIFLICPTTQARPEYTKY